MRLILSLFLSLLLALALQSEAVARSEMAGSYDQVVCGANGAEQITLMLRAVRCIATLVFIAWPPVLRPQIRQRRALGWQPQ